MTVHELLRLDLADDIEHLLRPPHREGGNHHVSAPVQRPLDHLRQRGPVVRPLAMAPVSVGGFDQQIVRRVDFLRLLQNWLIMVAHVAGEDDFRLLPLLLCPDLDRGASEQMPRVVEPDPDPVKDIDHLVIRAGNEAPHDPVHVLRRIERNEGRKSLPAALPVPPLRLELLDAGGIQQHDVAEIAGGRRGVNAAAEASCAEQRKKTRVIDVGVRHEDGVDLGGGDGERCIFKDVAALLHTVINQNAAARGRK